MKTDIKLRKVKNKQDAPTLKLLKVEAEAEREEKTELEINRQKIGDLIKALVGDRDNKENSNADLSLDKIDKKAI